MRASLWLTLLLSLVCSTVSAADIDVADDVAGPDVAASASASSSRDTRDSSQQDERLATARAATTAEQVDETATIGTQVAQTNFQDAVMHKKTMPLIVANATQQDMEVESTASPPHSTSSDTTASTASEPDSTNSAESITSTGNEDVTAATVSIAPKASSSSSPSSSSASATSMTETSADSTPHPAPTPEHNASESSSSPSSPPSSPPPVEASIIEEIIDAPEFLSFNDWKDKYVVVASEAPAVKRSKKTAQRAKQDAQSGQNTFDGDGADLGSLFSSSGTSDEANGGSREEGTVEHTPERGRGQASAASGSGSTLSAEGTPMQDKVPIVGPANVPLIQPLPNVGTGEPSDPLLSLKDRSNYAAYECAAMVHRASRQSKGASAILVDKKDRYMLTPCSAEPKFVEVELCDEIQIDTIVLANFELFSSMFKHFEMTCSVDYPGRPDTWHKLGTFRARNARGVQVFRPDSTPRFCRYVRINFLSHYGSEYYCPVSLLRVYGYTQFDAYRESERKKAELEAALALALEEGEADEDEEEEMQVEEPKPTESTTTVTASDSMGENVSASATTTDLVEQAWRTATKVLDTLLSPSHSDTPTEFGSTTTPDLSISVNSSDESSTQASTSASAATTATVTETRATSTETATSHIDHPRAVNPTASPSAASSLPSSALRNDTATHAPTAMNASQESPLPSASHRDKTADPGSSSSVPATSTVGPDTSSKTVTTETTSDPGDSSPTSIPTASSSPPVSQNASSTVSASADATAYANATHSNTHSSTSIVSSTISTITGTKTQASETPTVSARQIARNDTARQMPPLPPITPQQPQPGESIYVTIMKRLNILEQNQTIAMHYIEAQSTMLRDAFLRVERRLKEVENMHSRQEQSFRGTLYELEKQRLDIEAERLALVSQVNLLAQEVRLEKRLSIAQLFGLLAIVIFVVATRGTPTSPFLHLNSSQALRRAAAQADAQRASASTDKPKPNISLESDGQRRRMNSRSEQTSIGRVPSLKRASISAKSAPRRHYGNGPSARTPVLKNSKTWTPPLRHSSAPPDDLFDTLLSTNHGGDTPFASSSRSQYRKAGKRSSLTNGHSAHVGAEGTGLGVQFETDRGFHASSPLQYSISQLGPHDDVSDDLHSDSQSQFSTTSASVTSETANGPTYRRGATMDDADDERGYKDDEDDTILSPPSHLKTHSATSSSKPSPKTSPSVRSQRPSPQRHSSSPAIPFPSLESPIILQQENTPIPPPTLPSPPPEPEFADSEKS